ncbi:hypothetical protein Tco_0086803 [Tanacetum coccineum]
MKEKMESQSETTQTMSVLKLLVLKTRDYDIWSLRMEQHLTHTDYALWEVIMNGDAPALVASASGGTEGPISPKTTKQKLARKNELKAKSTLLLAIPNEHLLMFHGIKDAKSLWEAIKTRSEGLDKTYDRFLKLISQLEIQGEAISQVDANLKLLRSLPSAWNNIALIMRNKADLDTLSMDDLYYNLKVYEAEIKSQSTSSLNSQNVAFVSSENKSSTNEAVNTAHDVNTASLQGQASTSTYADDVMFSFFATQSNSLQLDNEDLEQIDTDDLEEMDLKWQWVPPCRVLRNWNEQVCTLLADSLIQNHLGLGYLNKDIVLSYSLARALGIKSSGPKILVKMLSSLCCTEDSLTTMGHKWLSSGLNKLHSVSIQNTDAFKVDYDVMNTLRKTPFIPLLGGCYNSIEVGTIWMSLNGSWANLEAFTILFFNLRIWLSEHEIVKAHVLLVICDKKNILNTDLMREYLSFMMVHFQSNCSKCGTKREDIISEVYKKAYILTNHGFVPPSEVEIHFGNDFGNHIDICRFISGFDVTWYEVDNIYMMWEKESIPPGSTVTDWESRELVDLLAKVSSSCDCEKKCKHLFEVLEQI